MSLPPSPEWNFSTGLVDFGYRVHDSLIPRPPYHQPLPSKPPPAGDPRSDLCGCPACLSGGFYAVSPACRFWRTDCEVCDGHRTYTYRTPGSWRRVRVDCFRCVEEWQDAVAWFYLVLGDPTVAAQRLATTASDTASGWGGATFEEADRANEYEEARTEKYWRDRETAADREIDALASTTSDTTSDTASDSATDAVSNVPSDSAVEGRD